MKKALKERMSELGLVAWILIITMFAAVVLGGFSLAYRKVIGVRSANIEREIFLESQSQVQGAIRDLANYRRQYNQAEDDSEKKAISQLIVNRLSHLDPDYVDDRELRDFLLDVRRGNL